MKAHFALVVIFTSDPNPSDQENKVHYDNSDCERSKITNLDRAGKRF
jgi:hypothetical protein